MDNTVGRPARRSLPERMAGPARVLVSVVRTDALSLPPLNLWFEEFVMSRAESVDVRCEVESLVDQLGGPYRISTESGRTSWGADSGEVVSVLLFVAGAVTQAVLEHKVNDLFTGLRQRQSDRWATARPLDRDEAIWRAKWIVSQRYGEVWPSAAVDMDDLQVIGESEDREASTRTITLSAKPDWIFDVVLRTSEGLVTVARLDMRRERLPA